MTAIGKGIWRMAHGRSLELGEKGWLMAIVNVTPDSFSDGGDHETAARAIEHALACVEEGAVIIDIGGESTRPGAAPVTEEAEKMRVLPVIAALAKRSDVLISIDTYRAGTALAAIEAGAHIINDVWAAQREPAIADVAARTGAGLCLMHSGRERQKLEDVIEDQRFFLERSLAICDAASVPRENIVLDPGFGFAKETADENFALMARFEELACFGLPLLAGTSRKRFLGTATGRDARDRDVATAATTAILRLMGASLFRVHNVAINRDALAVADAMLAARHKPGVEHGA